MKIVKRLTDDPNWSWDSIPFCHSDKARGKAIQILKNYEMVPVDLDGRGYKNNKDTLVIGIPDISSLEILYEAPEWINEWTVDLMELVALLRPDEFERIGISYDDNNIEYVIRFWWD